MLRGTRLLAGYQAERFRTIFGKYCLPPDPLYLRGTHPGFLYLEDAWWRERGFAALKIYMYIYMYSYITFNTFVMYNL